MKQSSQDIVEFKFSVFENSTGYYVQETDLVALKIKIHEELMKIDFHMEDNIGDQNAFTASVSNVEKLTVKGGSVIGLAVTVVTTVSMLVAILQYAILVKYRNHDVVKTAGLSFLTLMTVAMMCIYPVLFTSIDDPTRVKCSIEVILASIGVGLSTSVLLCRAIHIYLTCDNEIVCKSAIPKHLFTRYIVVVCASLLYNVVTCHIHLALLGPSSTYLYLFQLECPLRSLRPSQVALRFLDFFIQFDFDIVRIVPIVYLPVWILYEPRTKIFAFDLL
ncbi:hypothetical protein BKA69DRAFT_451379 [Paraphysoderma sedebokerense]|nr:hypothetical protein BKA69DRAFT_451379 [Paraphysoderma sedebokerense]